MNNKVKILLATYNGERYIREQIESILSQEGVEINILINDDGSRDQTVNILQTHYKFLKLGINHPGLGSAANNFLNMVSNLNFDENFQYVAFSDQDDIWLEQKMKVAINMLAKKSADLYCSNLTKWDNSTDSYSLLKKDFPQKKFDFLFEGGSAGCTYVFTKEFAKLLQSFLKVLDTSNWKGLSHDWLIYFFARSRNHKVIIDANSYIHYRLHSDNVHGHLNKLTFATIKEKSGQVLDGYYQNHAKNYIKYLRNESEEHKIYEQFLGNYYQRNKIIWRYNTTLMRDKKKFLIFAVLNLLKFR
ncbi:glycosyltransferase [Pedobacter sp. 22226]|uniref:glycosyltransferase n=1 Tax=Pedobacter sp. 22226 TaxID=3453894 RepID=UPI003F83E63A